MHKVFINDKPLYIISEGNTPQLSEKNILKLNYWSEKEIQVAFDTLLTDINTSGALIISSDVEKLWKKFCEQFKILEAAGGLVLNEEKELLMIYRFEKWDFPKGKLEKNERPEEGALREVCEETGVCDCEIIGELTSTYHTYIHREKNILKKTFWFEMKCKSFESFELQNEEGIMDAKWMNKENLKDALKNTYSSISDLLKNYLR